VQQDENLSRVATEILDSKSEEHVSKTLLALEAFNQAGAAVKRMREFLGETQNPEKVAELMKSMFDASKSPSIEPISPHKEVKVKDRVYIDGCFDMIHSGHYNAIR